MRQDSPNHVSEGSPDHVSEGSPDHVSEGSPRHAPATKRTRARGFLRGVDHRELGALLLLLVMLVVLRWYKVQYTASTFVTSIDGGYYTDVAKHVRDGLGLTTNVSLRHKGYTHFPHPTAVYPLWPLVYGYIAKLFPLFEAGKWTVTVFYFMTLVLGYLWANRVLPGPLVGRHFPWLNAGHVFVLLFGLNSNVQEITSMPFTEGLGYMILLLCLWRCAKLFQRPRAVGGAEIGIYAALLLLARPQLVLFSMAAAPALLFAAAVAKENRLAYSRMAAGFFGGFVLTLLPRYIHLSSFVPDFELSHILRFDEVYFNDVLSRHEALRPSPDWVVKVERILQGFEVAFAWDGGYSYSRQYYTAHYALLLIVPFGVYQAARQLRLPSLKRTASWLRCPEAQPWVLLLVFSLGAFLSMHVLQRYSGWYFQRRHCLPAFFLIFLALIALFRQGVVGRLLGMAVLCSSLYLGGAWVHSTTMKAVARADAGRAGDYPALVAWFREEAKRHKGPLVIAMRQPGRISWKLDGIGFHHYDYRTRLSDVLRLVTHFGTDYVLVPARRAPGFARAKEFQRQFRYRGARSGHRIYAPGPALLQRRVKYKELAPNRAPSRSPTGSARAELPVVVAAAD